jgi:uncharacterized protein YggE
MRKLYLFAFAAVLFCQPFIFSEENQSNYISVSGKAEIFAPADQAQFSFSVNGFGANLRAAVEQAKNKSKEISAKLLKLGLKENNLATSYFYSGENFEGKAFLSSTRDYKASITVNVTIDSLPALEESILCLSECSVENISSISFSLRNVEEVKEKARLKAVETAKNKAVQIAASLNVRLGQVKSFEETDALYPPYLQSPNPFNSVNYMARGDGQSGSGFFAQNVSITGMVKVVYEIDKTK